MKKIEKILLFIFVICSAQICSKKEEPVPEPIALFDFMLNTNGQVKFVNNSQNAVNYKWDFGDGEFSEEKEPTHIYKDLRRYIVKLTVQSITSHIGNAQKEINVNNLNPVPVFSFEAKENGQTVFLNHSKYSEKYLWTFGDGQMSTDSSPAYIYKKNGSYKVKLLAENSFGKDSIEKEVKITNIEPHCILSSVNDESIDTYVYYNELNNSYGVKFYNLDIIYPTYKDGILVQFGSFKDFEYDSNKRLTKFNDIHIEYDSNNNIIKLIQINLKYSQYFRFEYDNGNLMKMYTDEHGYGLNGKEIEVSNEQFDTEAV